LTLPEGQRAKYLRPESGRFLVSRAHAEIDRHRGPAGSRLRFRGENNAPSRGDDYGPRAAGSYYTSMRDNGKYLSRDIFNALFTVNVRNINKYTDSALFFRRDTRACCAPFNVTENER